MAGMLAACVGLTACGGGNSSSSSAASSSAAASSASASSAAASSSASASSAASSSSAAAEAAENQIVFWQGTLPDGQVVLYSDDALSGLAALSVAKSDFSDASVWYGPASLSPEGAVTITDAETGNTISFVLNGMGASAMNVELQNYGAVELQPVTKADYKAFIQELKSTPEGKKLLKEARRDAKKAKKRYVKQAKKLMNEFNKLDGNTVLFWNGTLADGTSVSFMDNPEGKEAYLAIVKADGSDGAAWYGKYSTTQDGKVIIISDSETGENLAYEVIETNPGTSTKLAVNGVGEVELSPVTKDEFVKQVEELAKQAEESQASASSASSASKAS